MLRRVMTSPSSSQSVIMKSVINQSNQPNNSNSDEKVTVANTTTSTTVAVASSPPISSVNTSPLFLPSFQNHIFVPLISLNFLQPLAMFGTQKPAVETFKIVPNTNTIDKNDGDSKNNDSDSSSVVIVDHNSALSTATSFSSLATISPSIFPNLGRSNLSTTSLAGSAVADLEDQLIDDTGFFSDEEVDVEDKNVAAANSNANNNLTLNQFREFVLKATTNDMEEDMENAKPFMDELFQDQHLTQMLEEKVKRHFQLQLAQMATNKAPQIEDDHHHHQIATQERVVVESTPHSSPSGREIFGTFVSTSRFRQMMSSLVNLAKKVFDWVMASLNIRRSNSTTEQSAATTEAAQVTSRTEKAVMFGVFMVSGYFYWRQVMTLYGAPSGQDFVSSIREAFVSLSKTH